MEGDGPKKFTQETRLRMQKNIGKLRVAEVGEKNRAFVLDGLSSVKGKIKLRR